VKQPRGDGKNGETYQDQHCEQANGTKIHRNTPSRGQTPKCEMDFKKKKEVSITSLLRP
jgi:hypothetical protein